MKICLRSSISKFSALHDDESGETRDIVMIGALITIPLVMLLITFGKQIGEWLKSSFSGISGVKDNVPKTIQ